MTIGEDFIQIDRPGEIVEEGGQFNAQLNQSVIESDYSSDYEEEDYSTEQSGRHAQRQTTAVNRGFMKGCYVSEDTLNDVEY